MTGRRRGERKRKTMDVRLRENIDWVGYVDWTVRDFHGYHTHKGSTYNAYLLRDDKTALIDTVKAPFADQLLRRLSELTDLDRIDFVVCNHAEPDHSGALPEAMRVCPRAELVCNEKCRAALSRHYDTSAWKFRVVSDGERLPLGRRGLTFIDTPMAHWPESMFTYVAEEKLLFSMDAFGQHYASSGRFDDEEPLDAVLEEARTYYANIVMPYGKQVARVLDRAAGLEIDTIAPSHGIIWRKHIGDILTAYRDWVICKPKAKALVIYDSMWQSTEKMAQAVMEGAIRPGVDAKLYHVRRSGITVLASEILDAAAVAFGTPTLNGTMMPEMAALLTYLKGLRPAGKAGFTFGSYGWAKGGAREAEDFLKEMRFEMLGEPIQSQFVPTDEILEECRARGRELSDKAISLASRAQ